MIRTTLAALLVALLAGCASPYQHALDTWPPERPQPPMTAADRDALAPYMATRYFGDQR
jgi:hypothetical protein